MKNTGEGADTGPDRRLVALVSGRVQGVGFRYWTRSQARLLGLRGAAVNRPDGTVEVTAEGSGPAVDRLLELLSSGQAPGRVDRVEVTGTGAAAGLAGFDLG